MGKAKILIIEDERIIAEDLKEILEDEGYEVCGIASDKEEAVEIAESTKPDLILVDIVLGEERKGGIEAAEKILSKQEIPVLYVTAYSDPEIFKEAKKVGPFGFLVKPINERELLMNVEIALYKSRTERELRKLNEEKEAAIQSLQRAESIMRSILESMLDTVFMLDGNGRFIFVNVSEKRKKFLNPDDFIGKTPQEAIPHKKAVDRVMDAFEENKKGRHVSYEGKMKIKDEMRIFLFSQSPVFIGNEFRGSVLVARDITDIKKYQEKLAESERRYRELFERVPVGIYRTTPEGEFLDANPAFLKLIGFESFKELKKIKPEELYLEKRVRKKWQKELEEKGIYYTEKELKRKDGKKIWVRESAIAVKDEKGRVLYYEGAIEDITESKELERGLRGSLRFTEKLLEEVIIALGSMVEVRDPYTAGHQKNVTKLAVAIAEEMGLERRRIDAIRVAGFLHDIGKISIPTEVLTKPTKLEDYEYELLKTHSQIGFEILKNIDFPWPIAEIVLQHHERMDGSGYPRGLKNGEILLEARILAVADVVEAMSSDRPYRPALGLDEAIKEISEKRGIKFDPDVVDACLKVLKKGFRFEKY